jgi:hypothetical protein
MLRRPPPQLRRFLGARLSSSLSSTYVIASPHSNFGTAAKLAVAGGMIAAGYVLYSKVPELAAESHALAVPRSEVDVLPECLRSQFFISKRTRCAVYFKRWPAAGKAKGDVFLVHGLGEHIGRYEHVAAALNDAGYNVFGMDHQGHGRSEGDRGHAERFQHMVDDYLQVEHHSRRRLCGCCSHAMPCHAMPCHAMPCHAPSYAMLC